MTNVTLETLNIHVTQQSDSLHDDTITPNKTSKVNWNLHYDLTEKRSTNFLILYHRCPKTCKQINRYKTPRNVLISTENRLRLDKKDLY